MNRIAAADERLLLAAWYRARIAGDHWEAADAPRTPGGDRMTQRQLFFHFELYGPDLLTANQRLHWAEKSRRTRNLRAIARYAAHATAPILGPADLHVLIEWPDRRRRDPDNWAPTVKALVDGLVDAGILPDDDMQHRPTTTYAGGCDPTLRPRICRITLTLTPLEECPNDSDI